MRWFSSMVGNWMLDCPIEKKRRRNVEDERNHNHGNNQKKKNFLQRRSSLRTPLSRAPHPEKEEGVNQTRNRSYKADE